MGNPKRPISCDAMNEQNSFDQDVRPTKTQKLQLNHFIEQFKIDEEMEDRLGRLQAIAQWIMKVAQNRGATTCLLIRSIENIQFKNGNWTLSVHTLGNQRLNLTFSGQWFEDALQYFRQNGKIITQQPFLLSGLGASIHPSSDKINISSTNCCLYIIDISASKMDLENVQWHGWLEVTDGTITERPSRYSIKPIEDRDISSSPSDVPFKKALQSMRPTPQPSLLSPSPEFEQPPKPKSTNDLFASNLPRAQKNADLCEQQTKRDLNHDTIDRSRASPISSTLEPDWLQTPRSDRFSKSDLSSDGAPSFDQLPLKQTTFSKNAFSKSVSPSPAVATFTTAEGKTSMTKAAMRQATEERIIGTYRIHPINKIEQTSKKLNSFGRCCSEEKPFRSSGGSGDYKLSIYLQDILPLRPNNEIITFNLFASEISRLPPCKENDVVAIFGFGVKPFQSTVQGTGYKGFEWILLDSKTGKFQYSNMIDKVRVKPICDEMRAHFDKWNERKEKNAAKTTEAESAIPFNSRLIGRQLLEISQVEANTFFDVNVQVVELWDGNQPCIYATDYTCHPHLPLIQDVRLNTLPRDQLQLIIKNNNNEGGGRTMPIYPWKETQNALSSIKAGDFLTLRNVRPKLNPAGFLEGNMGDMDSSKYKLNIFHAGEDAIKMIKERRKAYEEECALIIAEQSFQNILETPGRQKRGEESVFESPSNTRSDFSSSISRTPSVQNGQRTPQSEERIGYEYDLNDNGMEDRKPIIERSKSKRPQTSNFVILDEEFEQHPITHLDDVMQCEPAKIGESETYRSCVRIRGTPKPKRMCNWVTIECLKCQKKLPENEALCKNCASMEDDFLKYSFRLGFLLEDSSEEEPVIPLIKKQRIQNKFNRQSKNSFPIALGNENASYFFLQSNPRDFRLRKKQREKVALKLVPLLGNNSIMKLLRSGDDDDDDDNDDDEDLSGRQSFDVVIRVTRLQDEMGKIKCKFNIEGCKLAV